MSIHDRLLQRPIILFVFLVIATLFLGQSSKTITSKAEIEPVQFFSVEQFAIPHLIDPNDFQTVLQEVEHKITLATFYRFFYIDFGWALLLLLNIYVLSMKAAGRTRPIRWLIVILAFAYGFDLLENFSYLTGAPLLVQYLEYTNQVKLLFYAIGIGSLLYFAGRWVVRKIKKRN